MHITPIAYIHTDFKDKFGIPRQSGRAPTLQGIIEFADEYKNPEALRGIEQFSHLWLLFDFSLAHREGWQPTVRPPRLGGNKRVGVFASRSPFRPNNIGLSCVKLVKVEEGRLFVEGVDLLDGTPIYDIKPYIPHADCHADAVGGYADDNSEYRLDVVFSTELLEIIPKEKRQAVIDCLADDPRPAYQDDPNRVYSMGFAEFDIKFRVEENTLTVIGIDQDK